MKSMLHSINLGAISLETYANQIKNSPLGIFNSSQNDYKIIPAAIDPLILDDTQWHQLAAESRQVLSAMQKVSRWLRQPANSKTSSLLYSDLSPIEKKVVWAESNDSIGLATVRFDLFFDGEDLKIIEVNTTIPAMQAYSDMTKNAYIKAWIAEHRPTFNRIFDTTLTGMQSNALDLLSSLVEHFERSGGKGHKPCIAIVSRRGDSQTAELLWLQTIWQEAGHDCILAFPDDVSIDNGRLQVNKTPIDLIYRHIFANRLVPDSDFALACIHSQQFRVFNPISAHLELKGLLAEVSRIATDETQRIEVGLSADEVHAIHRRVPWSRILIPGDSLTPGSNSKENLIKWLKGNQTHVVLKSSSGYGGQMVIVGEYFERNETQSALRKIMGNVIEKNISWSQFVDFCATSTDQAWIAQLRISGRQSASNILTGEKVKQLETFMDCSLFSNSGTTFHPQGAASRFSIDPVVNIAKGGGLVPVLFKSEVDQLLALR